ncbi:hypothetical protein GCU56_21610 [Geodermatophilus sabuli]|uniref:Uncharacterized protein n=1 Tax=Geodermatophilus sabuli TaxID=1564158 RepID=A0A7K3W6H6_9ACTN|nr:hypothetical protein [Geodermatophilus sabuli]NEK60459.1 hypothetical protein [Geodermatophilus sabuli]
MTGGICVVLAIVAWVLTTSGAAVWYAHCLTGLEQHQRRRPDRRHRWGGHHSAPH